MTISNYEVKPFADLRAADLSHANLHHANLHHANLYYANLYYANLRAANLYYADLCKANLYYADLSYANLDKANLQDADLRAADLSHANLRNANLRKANLRNADLRAADLRNADLQDAALSPFQIPQEGEITVWKKLKDGVVARGIIPRNARRTASLVGRKCRCEALWITNIFARNGRQLQEGKSLETEMPYKVSTFATPDKYDPDIRVECTHGIHFFLTRKEAEQY